MPARGYHDAREVHDADTHNDDAPPQVLGEYSPGSSGEDVTRIIDACLSDDTRNTSHDVVSSSHVIIGHRDSSNGAVTRAKVVFCAKKRYYKV